MAGKPGRSGTNKNQDKPWIEALQIVANEYCDDKPKLKKLRRVAERVFEAAMNGDMAAAKEIGDRLDGKPMQAVEVTGDVLHHVARLPAPIETIGEWKVIADKAIQ